MFYVSTFHVSQREMLESIMRVSGNTDKDWEISTPESEDVDRQCDERLAKGEMEAFYTKFMLASFREGNRGSFEDKDFDMRKLGYEKEDIDAVSAAILRRPESGKSMNGLRLICS
jgi:hypothetical protein